MVHFADDNNFRCAYPSQDVSLPVDFHRTLSINFTTTNDE